MTRLFVGKLDFATKEEELKEFFAAYNCKEVKIIKTPIGYSKGFGFVDVATPEDAQKALEKNGQKLGKMEIRVQIALTEEEKKKTEKKRRGPFKGRRNFQGKRTQKRRPIKRTAPKAEKKEKQVSKCGVYVKNLPFDMVEEEFKEAFKAYETETVTLVMRKKDPKKNYGYGFVIAKTEEGQKKIIAEMNEKELKGRKIICAASFETAEKK